MRLGEFLKKYRKAFVISGHRLSQKMGVSKHALEKWENAGVMPGHEATVKLLHYFGLSQLLDISEETLIQCIIDHTLHPAKKPDATKSDIENPYQLLMLEKDNKIRELEKIIALLKELLKG